MPHPPPHNWACPCDQSLQLLYLQCYVYKSTHLQNYKNQGGAALPPCWLRGPLPLRPTHAPEWHLVATPAHAGSHTQGSGHQWWHPSQTTGHQKRGVPPHPRWPPTPTNGIITPMFQPLLCFHPIQSHRCQATIQGPLLPVHQSPHVHPPLAHHPPAHHLPLTSAHHLLPLRGNHQTSLGGSRPRAPRCGLPPGGCVA